MKGHSKTDDHLVCHCLVTFAFICIFSSCSNGRPSGEQATLEFKRLYPRVQLLNVEISEDEVVARSFNYTYRTDHGGRAEIRIQFMQDQRGHWVPQPAAPAELPGVVTNDRRAFLTYDDELKARDVRQKRWDDVVDAAIAEVTPAIGRAGMKLHTQLHYGAMGIDPSYLAVWYIFPSDAELALARSADLCSELGDATRAALKSRGFPEQALPNIHVGCESHETIMREAGGNYFHFFK